MMHAQIQWVKNTIKRLRGLRHPNILKFIDTFEARAVRPWRDALDSAWAWAWGVSGETRFSRSDTLAPQTDTHVHLVTEPIKPLDRVENPSDPKELFSIQWGLLHLLVSQCERETRNARARELTWNHRK
jgi:hypothetical protein